MSTTTLTKGGTMADKAAKAGESTRNGIIKLVKAVMIIAPIIGIFYLGTATLDVTDIAIVLLGQISALAAHKFVA